MLPVLEAVPNFSEGEDLAWVRAVVEVIDGPLADDLGQAEDVQATRGRKRSFFLDPILD